MRYEYLSTRVIPSYLGSRECGVAEDSGMFSSMQLFQGEVKKAIYPGDPDCTSKHCVEYTVSVEYRTGSGPATMVTFPNCRVMNVFGGIADRCRYTLRSDPGTATGDEVFGVGSKVLILCLLGERNRGYIIGGLRDDKDIDSAKDGHNYYWEFNGISAKINDSGEFKLQFMGKTDVKGGLAKGVDADASPTTLEITKDGSLEIYTKDRNQYLKFDHANKKVTFQADNEWDVQVNGKSQMNVGGPVDWSFGNTCSIAIKQNTSVNIFAGKLDITAPLGQVNIKSMGVNVGLATNAWPLFTVYRLAEVTMHTAVMAALTTAAASLAAAGSVMTIPVAGAIAAAVPINAASAAITAAVTALTAFEALAPAYLSLKNRSD